MTVKFTRLRLATPEPVRAHPWDAGVDLVADAVMAGGDVHTNFGKSYIARAGGTAMFGTGVAVAIPVGYVGLVFVRSSIGVKRHLVLANGTGVIDSGYTGEVMVCLLNEGDAPVAIEHGERIAQLVVVPCSTSSWVEVDGLDETERGQGGFGSSGRR